MADGDQHVVQPAASGEVVVDLIGGDQAGAAALRHRRPPFEHPRILGLQVVVELAEDVLLAQRLLEPAQA